MHKEIPIFFCHTLYVDYLLMTKIEKKVMLVLMTLLLINSLFLLAHQSEIASYLLNLNSENTFDTLIVFSLVGLHAMFALLTMWLSFNGVRYLIRYYSLCLSLLAPVVFLFINFKIILSYQTDSQYFFSFSLIACYLFIKKSEEIKSQIYKYINTLVNPLRAPWH